MVKRQLTQSKRCGVCKASRNRRCWMWQCSSEMCGTHKCLKCHRDGSAATGLQIAPAVGVTVDETRRASEAVNVENEVASETVLERLQQLPPVLLVKVPEKNPARARRRIGKIMIKLMNKFWAKSCNMHLRQAMT